MPRNRKCRRVCQEPAYRMFIAAGTDIVKQITVEEVEALRLCDLEDLSQDQAAEQMNVSRGTLQRILYAAHKKAASALCLGHGLEIRGGDYEVADGFCGCRHHCRKCRFSVHTEENADE